MKRIKVLDKVFEVSIPEEDIQSVVSGIAARMNHDFKGKDVVFLCVLNGSFMFASDLMKNIKINSKISFIKLASYEGTSTTGAVKKLVGLNEDIKGKTVVVIEDIVDTGITLEKIISELDVHEPADIRVATLVFKPKSYQKKFRIDYIGMEVPNDFILGYGMDYDGYGRNLTNIYTLVEDKSYKYKLNIVLFGPPGAGKGTQASRLIDKYDLLHISTGDILRMEIADETAIGIEARKRIDKGELVPDAMVIEMIRTILNKNPDVKGYIFDGFPRTKVQAEVLDEMLEERGHFIDAMITLDVDHDEIVSRLVNRGKESGRADDQNVAIIENRMDIYNKVTAPVIDFYEDQGKYRPVEGMGSMDAIFDRLCKVIDRV